MSNVINLSPHFRVSRLITAGCSDDYIAVQTGFTTQYAAFVRADIAIAPVKTIQEIRAGLRVRRGRYSG
jgi:hypothetical protein